MALGDFSGVVPRDYSAQIIEEATQASAALTLGQRLPMGTRISELPIPKTFPKAEWVTSPYAGAANTGRKPYTDIGLQPQVITAEEVAAVIAIPEVYLDDNEINLWNFCRPRLAEAIGVAVDDAMLFGLAGATPATFPNGGVAGAAQVVNPANADDVVDAVNQAMALVEADGLAVTGHAADLIVKSRLRGVRDSTGALLLGTEQVGQTQRPTIYGVPVAYNPFTQLGATVPDFITGAWQYLIIGVRQDIRFKLNPSGVILGTTTANSVSGFQDNVVPMKVWARFGCAIVSPPTVRRPAGSRPFARVKLADVTSAAGALLGGHPHPSVAANHPHGPVTAEAGDEGGKGSARK
jgi:HK97 family phage major capsid protein